MNNILCITPDVNCQMFGSFLSLDFSRIIFISSTKVEKFTEFAKIESMCSKNIRCDHFIQDVNINTNMFARNVANYVVTLDERGFKGKLMMTSKLFNIISTYVKPVKRSKLNVFVL